MKLSMMLAVLLSCAPGLALAADSGAAAPLDDASLALTLRTANDAEIQAARTASEKTGSASVKDFAQMMLLGHQKSNEDIAANLKRMGEVPQENAMATSLRSEAETQASQLASQSGDAFDKAYLDQQVDAHKKVLSLLDDALSNPVARDPQFRALLENTRETVRTHLEHAEGLQANAKTLR